MDHWTPNRQISHQIFFKLACLIIANIPHNLTFLDFYQLYIKLPTPYGSAQPTKCQEILTKDLPTLAKSHFLCWIGSNMEVRPK
jgi:hypothetical protein